MIYLGRIVDPIKNAMYPISNVVTKLNDGLFRDNNKKIENSNRTINGLKR